MKLKLRDYQTTDVNALRQCFRNGDRAVLYQLSTGGGKTVCFSHIAEGASKRGNVVMILVHRQELVRQSSASLHDIGVQHGVIAPGFTPDPLANVHIASVQTLVRRLDKVPTPNLIIIDEAHHATAASWDTVIKHFSGAKILGVTATPTRLDNRGLGRHCGGHFDSMVNGPTLSWLISNNYLSRPRLYAPPVGADLNNLHKRFGEFKQGEVAAAMDKPVITGSAVEHYRKLCNGIPSIAFCVSVAHAEHVAEQFRAAGYQAASVDGTMHDNDRKGRIAALGNGGLHVLTSCDLISEGTDVCVVGAAILLRPTASLSLVMQQIGRALRIYPGKECAYILDHVGNIDRHQLHFMGLPEGDIEWSLDGEVKKKKKAEEKSLGVKQCPECYAVHLKAPACPFCGYQYKPEGRQLEQVDGELAEIDDVTRERLSKFERDRERQFLRREEGMCRSLEELQELGRRRGYNEAWARIRWKQKQRNSSPALKLF